MKKFIKPKNWFSIALTFLIISCTAIYENGKEIAAEKSKYVKPISVDALNAKFENSAEFLLIDCRQYNEYNAGNIPGSFNVPRGEIEFKILNDAFWEEEYMYTPYKTDTIIIYCKSGTRGILATYSLMELGFENIYNLEGGWIAYNGGVEPSSQEKHSENSSGGCGD